MPIESSPSRQPGAGHYLLRSLIFLALLGALGFLFREQLSVHFEANVYLNGTILGLFVLGALYAVKALLEAYADSQAIGWAQELVRNARRDNRPVKQLNEVLLSVNSRLSELLNTLHRVASQRDSNTTLPYLLDSIASRGEDRRALVRYLTGALVMLGLIGTFYGLLITIGGVRDVIGGFSADAGADTVTLLAGLKEQLARPLAGMSTAFSTSLYGLLASLIMAFLELQLFHAQNNVQSRLETVVVSELMPLWQQAGPRPMVSGATSQTGDPRYQIALLQAVVERLDRVAATMESLSQSRDGGQRVAENLGALNERLDSLRDTLESVERDRTAELRHELRALANLQRPVELPPQPEPQTSHAP